MICRAVALVAGLVSGGFMATPLDGAVKVGNVVKMTSFLRKMGARNHRSLSAWWMWGS